MDENIVRKEKNFLTSVIMGAIEGENNKQIRSCYSGFYLFQGKKRRNGREYVHWFVIVYQIF